MQLPNNFIEARKLLLRTYPFYGLPALGSEIVLTDGIPTACTDGTKIMISPKFMHQMPVPHLAFVIAHECVHILRADPDMGARGKWSDGSKITNLKKLNVALDFWINAQLKAEGFVFPTKIKVLYDPKYDGKTVRQIYDSIPDSQCQGGQGQQGQSGSQQPGQGSAGDMESGDDVIIKPMSASEQAEHRIKVQQAFEAARSAGKVPGWGEAFVEKIKSPKIQFKDLLEAWFQDVFSKEDISYRRLNRHYLPDYFVPTTIGTSFGKIWIFMDTSGSCWNEAPLFLSLVNKALKQMRPIETTLQQFDYGLQGPPRVFQAGETIDVTKVKVYGGGGTSFVHPFQHLREKNIEADGVIVLTDMCGEFPSWKPSQPVLWVSTIKMDDYTAPFGKTYYLKHGEEDLED